MSRDLRPQLPEFAFYYPQYKWRAGSTNWIKNLLLFFDGIALLVPASERDHIFANDPELMIALQNANVLKIIEPETFITKNMARQLCMQVIKILESGMLDELCNNPTVFQQLTLAQTGSYADHYASQLIIEELTKHGLTRPATDEELKKYGIRGLGLSNHNYILTAKGYDGVSQAEYGMHVFVEYKVYALIRTLLANILRPTGPQHGFELCPITDDFGNYHAFRDLLGLPSTVSTAHVVSLDLETVGIDLTTVPLDEVLDFRAEYHDAYRQYARNLKQFVRQVSILAPEHQDSTLIDRRIEIAEAALSLRKVATRTWKSRASFALSAAGAIWTVTTGDLVGGLLAIGAGIAGAELTSSAEPSAYTYLFTAGTRL